MAMVHAESFEYGQDFPKETKAQARKNFRKWLKERSAWSLLRMLESNSRPDTPTTERAGFYYIGEDGAAEVEPVPGEANAWIVRVRLPDRQGPKGEKIYDHPLFPE
jgi:hypothetical protein